jgi:hypothetical protein
MRKMNSLFVDSGAEKEIILVSLYLDFVIVQSYSASTHLFAFSEQTNLVNDAAILDQDEEERGP